MRWRRERNGHSATGWGGPGSQDLFLQQLTVTSPQPHRLVLQGWQAQGYRNQLALLNAQSFALKPVLTLPPHDALFDYVHRSVGSDALLNLLT